ncbi:hypothetical protein KCU98_g12577, partial [Aureobasidium melanogenum]
HSQLKTGHPVRSAIHKQLNGRLVLRWVTTWESLLLYVLILSSFALSNPQLLEADMSRRTMAILGCSIQDGKEYLEIDDFSDQEVNKSGVYSSMILDESENLVGLYVGSRTGLEGVY